MYLSLFEVKKVSIPSNLLSDRFLVPPFSVFDTKQGYWQERKRNWIKLGIKSESGRGDNFLGNSGISSYGKCLPGSIGEKFGRKPMNSTSIFDPVLCEIAYKWFSVDNAKILDPFAGGSVRGIIAGSLGRRYTGVDLSEKQIYANEIQYKDISDKYSGIIEPNWINGDSLNIKNLVGETEFDLIFSCPPYYDLEVYSDKPNDLSNKNTYQDFLDIYRQIIKNCCDLLKDNSFAVFVVGNIRDKNGIYYDFVGDTVKAFTECGLYYYNEAIIVNVAGTLPVRVPNIFNSSRKLGKQHQQFLVFYKGDVKQIKDKFGSFDNSF